MTAIVRMPSGPKTDEHGRKLYRFGYGTKSAAFIASNNFVDVIEGPVGSGKTVTLCLRLMRHAQEQQVSPVDGLRHSRWFVARNTYPDLRRTTIRTWLECFPESLYGRFFWGQPPSHRIKFGDVRMEVDFLALDKEEDIRKLRSGEYTGGAFNELQYIEKALFDEAQSRVDRYPTMEHGGASWAGVLADANAPDEDHWLAAMTGQVDPPPGLSPDELVEYEWPSTWGFYLQPPALIENLDRHGKVLGYEVNPGAENLENLSPNYYPRQITGKKKSWIDSRLMVRVVLVVDGDPVYPMFRREFHVASKVLEPVLGNGHEVNVALDFGRSPAALFSQEINGREFIQFELQGFNESASTFAPRVKRLLEEKYPGCPFTVHGDPKGDDKGQANDETPFDVFAGYGMRVTPSSNNIVNRVEAVSFALNDNPAGVNRWVISPRCRTLIVGLAGRYCNEKDPETGELKPTKNKYSHLCNALEYKALSRGEGRRMTGRPATGGGKAIQGKKGRRSLRRRAG